ncbi:MAG: F0F1 ATP synthase subunit A [Sandaracinaceae bacterium]|nr:MAG: ATP synthase F0 subunit A [Sandaracinaceae bacterium]HBQ12292.1 ATP synthase F0 subunit A [Myxococcales bacterium]
MSEGSYTWSENLLQPVYENSQNAMHLMGWPFNDEGKTWGMLGSPVDIAHNPGHGTQALIHVGFVVILLAIVSFFSYSKIKDKHAALIPDDTLTLRTFVELFVGTAYNMMKDIMGGKAARFFLPLIGTCAFFILFSNAMGLVPGFVPPTSSLSVTLACAIIIFFATHIFGVKEHGLPYFKHFFGPIIKWYALPLMLLMFVVEVISHLVRPASLAVRLMANMFADHLVLSVFLGLVPFIVPVPILLLGSLVVVVQCLVFCILSTVYIAMAIEHSEDH